MKEHLDSHSDDTTTCSRCGKKGAKKRHQGSAYNDEERNYVTECDECFKQTEAYWDAQWEIYDSLRG